jgi:hypothetical protein
VGGHGSSGKGKVAGKRYRKINMVQILCTHVCKCKRYQLKLFQEWEGKGIKGEE